LLQAPSLFRLRDGSGTKKNIPYPVSDNPAEKILRFFNPFSFPYIATSPAIHYYNMEGNSIITVSIA